MNINIYQIAKNDKDEYDLIVKDFIKMSKKYANIKLFNLFNNNISKAQTIGTKEGQNSYSKVFTPKLKLNSYNIALDVKGKKLNSQDFSKILENKANINFFIGGAYGFEDEFLQKCNSIISLSNLTFSHKIANVVLFEQLFRGLCIKNNHPYHK
jgi:23S rRNA (pseudouridine1915-N3)-methyltransferase